jgi:UDP-N-acetylbacillosamine N-acetyltransferase
MSTPGGRIVIFGCGGHSRSVVDVLLSVQPDASLVFVDANAGDGEQIFGFNVCRDYPLGSEPIFLAIGDNAERKKLLGTLGDRQLISIVSNTAHLGQRSQIAPGCFVGNFCHIGPEAVIGKNTILNTASIIEHEVTIGAHSHIGPNATISGRCKIGDLVFIGVGATVRDKISICSEVMVGAGATVVADISDPGTYVGTPARRIK